MKVAQREGEGRPLSHPPWEVYPTTHAYYKRKRRSRDGLYLETSTIVPSPAPPVPHSPIKFLLGLYVGTVFNMIPSLTLQGKFDQQCTGGLSIQKSPPKFFGTFARLRFVCRSVLRGVGGRTVDAALWACFPAARRIRRRDFFGAAVVDLTVFFTGNAEEGHSLGRVGFPFFSSV